MQSLPKVCSAGPGGPAYIYLSYGSLARQISQTAMLPVMHAKLARLDFAVTLEDLCFPSRETVLFYIGLAADLLDLRQRSLQ